MSNLHVIYVPGFGDRYDKGRRPLFNCWRIFGVTTDFVPMRWESSESYAHKLARIDSAINRAKNKRIVLIGESAGASMVVAVHSIRHNELQKTMTISGKNYHGSTVAPRLYRQHVAFREAMRATDALVPALTSAARQNFISLYPIHDNTVPMKDAAVPGTRLIRLPSVGHFFTILLALTIFSGYLRFIARRP
jgi:hypothetical protein